MWWGCGSGVGWWGCGGGGGGGGVGCRPTSPPHIFKGSHITTSLPEEHSRIASTQVYIKGKECSHSQPCISSQAVDAGGKESASHTAPTRDEWDPSRGTQGLSGCVEILMGAP